MDRYNRVYCPIDDVTCPYCTKECYCTLETRARDRDEWVHIEEEED